MKKRLQTLCISILALIQTGLFGQTETSFICGTDEAQAFLLDNDTAYQQKMLNFEKYYQQQIQETKGGTTKSLVVYTIPVVVHIVHAGAPLGSVANPTDAQVQAIVEQASQRFRHMHPGAGTYSNPFYGVDTEIELCMATTDPNGNYTTGVTRHYDPANAVGTYNAVLPAFNALKWNTSLYCNLFIMTTMTNASGVYIGGYDFTIYDSGAFWSGLIAHEVGHYFSLAHTFQGGCPNGNCLTNGDLVCDTPPKATSGFNGTCANPGNGCTTDEDDTTNNNPYRPVSMGGMGDQPDMLANYLDYTGSCWDSYTLGQKTRMRANIDNNRVALKNNAAACSSQPIPANDAGVTAVNLNQSSACSGSFTPQVTFKNYGSATLTSVDIIVKVNGTTVATQPWTGSQAPNSSTTITLTNPVTVSVGTHVIAISTGSPNNASDANIYNDTEYRSVTYIGGTTCQTFQGCAPFNPATSSGPGNVTNVRVVAAFPATPAGVTHVQVCVKVEGDVSASSEVFNVRDESNTLRGQTNPGSDCGGFSPEFCFLATVAEYNIWRANDTITVVLDPVSTAINPTLCITNQGCASVIVPQGSSGPLSCTNLANPVNGSSNVPVTSALTWNASAGATGYRLTVGITPNGTDILNNFDVGNVTTYDPPGNFPFNTTIYVRITPYNANGDATGCQQESFSTQGPAGCPDLIVENLVFNSYSGSTLNVTYTVKNVGTATIPAGTNVGLQRYNSVDNIFTYPGDSPAGGFVINVGNMAPGGTISGSFNTTIDTNIYHYLVVQVDNNNNLAECSENNNVIIKQVLGGCMNPNAHNYNPAATVQTVTCQTCSDGIQNGDETGVDCGGAICTPCNLANPVLILLSFNQVKIKYHNPINPATATSANLKIWGDETGQRTGTYTVSADTVTFTATVPFRAGELIHITSKSGLQFTGGAATTPFSWVRQSPVTNPTAAVFDTTGTGIILPAAAFGYGFNSTMADVNRDGLQDIVFRYHASYGASTNVLVYLRNANGTFAAPVTYTNSESHSWLVGTPDLNNDGYPDLVITHNVPSRIQIRLNNGAGGFGAATLYTVSSFCNGAKVYDMDNDGDLDIVAYSGVSSLSQNTISILKNNGNGTFAAQVTTNTSVFGTSCQPADLDNDGDMDLAYTSNSAFSSAKVFRVYENDGNGALSLSYNETNNPEKAVQTAFDYNGDGNADLITRNPNTEIHLGNSGLNYTLNSPTVLSTEDGWPLSGDLDGDGDLDVFIGNSYNGSNWNTLPMKFLLNNGTGTFSTTTTSLVLASIWTSDLSDYDSDGDLDHLYLNPATGEIRVLLNGSNSAGSCIPNLVISMNPVPNGAYHSLGDLLSHSSTVANGTSVLFTSDTAILLEYDFTVEPGATFEAYIQGCNSAAPEPPHSALPTTRKEKGAQKD